jgi:hypothetical protein
MFANSKNVNISGGEFYIIYGAKTSETAQKGKHVFDRFVCLQISSVRIGIEPSRRRPCQALYTIQMNDMIPQNSTHTHERPFYKRSWTGSKIWIVRLGFCGCMGQQELESQRLSRQINGGAMLQDEFPRRWFFSLS